MDRQGLPEFLVALGAGLAGAASIWTDHPKLALVFGVILLAGMLLFVIRWFRSRGRKEAENPPRSTFILGDASGSRFNEVTSDAEVFVDGDARNVDWKNVRQRRK